MATKKSTSKKVNSSLTNKNQNSNTTMTTTTTRSKFVTNVLKELNKTDAQKQEDSVIEFAENAKIDVQLSISQISTGDLPRLQMELKKAENDLTRANTSYQKSRFSVASSTSAYISNRERALDHVEACQSTINKINNAISDKEAELATFEAILADLS